MQSKKTDQERTQFSSGAVRCKKVAGETENPLRYDLLIGNTPAMRRIAAVFAEGAMKFGDNNWKKGMPKSALMNHSLAHIVAYEHGDKSEDHLPKAVWGLMALMYMEECKPDMLKE